MGSILAKFLDDTCDSRSLQASMPKRYLLNPGHGHGQVHARYSFIYSDDIHSIQEPRKVGKDGMSIYCRLTRLRIHGE